MHGSEVKKIKDDALAELDKLTSVEDLEKWSAKFLGRKKGLLNSWLRKLSSLTEQERRELGPALNSARTELEERFEQKRKLLQRAEVPEEFSQVDITLPGTKPEVGGLHPLSRTRRELEDIFTRLGFAVVEGPELESDYYNFEALNIPAGHPARDMWDTFYIKSESQKSKSEKDRPSLLRTHTSPMQIRLMEQYKPPFAVIVPGRTYRHEATDARHEHTFDQLEGLAVGENISVANMKYVLKTSLSEFFEVDLDMQLRPSYFPFVEPGFEIAVSCTICSGVGCPVCSQGYLELLGAGMVHPKVFEYAGYKAGEYTGFAFGMGINRLAMIKYGIPDIRNFAENDYKFISQ